MIATCRTNVIAPIILPSVEQSSRLFFAALAYLSTILRARRKLFFIAHCIRDSNNGSAHAPFIPAACVLVFDRRVKWDTVAILRPFHVRISFLWHARGHRIADKLIPIIIASRFYVIMPRRGFSTTNKCQFACSRCCFTLCAAPRRIGRIFIISYCSSYRPPVASHVRRVIPSPKRRR